MGKVTLTRNLGTLDARILDVDPSEAREGRSIDVDGDVRDELVLQGLAHEGGEREGGIDLNDPEIRKKLEEKELEMNLPAALGQLMQERQREEFDRLGELERDLIGERDRLRRKKEQEGIKLMQERRDQPPKGPDEQPREVFGRAFGAGMPEVDEDPDQETRRKEEEKRRSTPERPAPSGPQQPQPQPGQPKPTPANPPGRPSGPAKK